MQLHQTLIPCEGLLLGLCYILKYVVIKINLTDPLDSTFNIMHFI